MVSVNFLNDSFRMSKPLTEFQEVSRNRCLNAEIELSLIFCLYKYLFLWWFSELIELLRLKAYVIGKWSDISVLRSVAIGGARGAMVPQLRFHNQTRSKSFSFKYQGYFFLWLFKNYADQKFHDFYHVCYNFWTIHGGFSFFLTT